MGFDDTHSDDDCDKCGKHVGSQKLVKVPFLFMDLNDDRHEDRGRGYRQYFVCKDCAVIENVETCGVCRNTYTYYEGRTERGLCWKCSFFRKGSI